MAGLPIRLPLEGIPFETAAAALSPDPGFVAIDARGASRIGRYSIVASRPARSFAFTGAFVTFDGHTTIDSPADALARFAEEIDAFQSDPYLPFSGGAIGYVGFEGARALKGFPPAAGFSRYPQCRFGIYTAAAVFDHAEGTAFVAANGTDERVAHRQAHDLLERLRSAPAWRSSPMPIFTAAGEGSARNSPQDGEFRQLLGTARSWLRSEAAGRLHVARQRTTPSTGASAIETFLSLRGMDCVRAIFTHEGAAAIVESRDILCDMTETCVRSRMALPRGPAGSAIEERLEQLRVICADGSIECTRNDVAPLVVNFKGQALGGIKAFGALLRMVPASTMAGRPLDRALTFISENESLHRCFYGGAFGAFDAKNLRLHSVHRSAAFADGALSLTTGVDLTAETDVDAAEALLASSLQI